MADKKGRPDKDTKVPGKRDKRKMPIPGRKPPPDRPSR